jgi:hypothetical protein
MPSIQEITMMVNTMQISKEVELPDGSKLFLIIPSFALFITGDLSYYAGALGMPSSTSYWCP